MLYRNVLILSISVLSYSNNESLHLVFINKLSKDRMLQINPFVIPFFSRPKDVGRPKAEVAAEFLNSRIPNCAVVAYPFRVK